jgi:hypothetical protein
MNSSRYRFDTEAVPDFAALCERFTGKTLRSPYRSTVPLLSLVEHSPQQWNELVKSSGAPTNATVHFEYCVASPKAGGNPSQTDALVMSDSNIWAVEAKWTEPRYETVAKRLSKPESDGADPKVTVDGWLKHLNRFAAHPLQVEDVKDVVYQVLHRAASTCAVATTQGCIPHLIYLHFHPSPLKTSATTDQYISDLRHLHTLLGRPASLKFAVVEMPLQQTKAFELIKDLDKRSPETSVQVSAALRQGPLFTFGTPTTTRIGHSAQL